MISELRWKFVAISMALTGIVLVGVLGSTLITTWNTQQDIIRESLERGLHDDMGNLPQVGGPRDKFREGNGGDSHLLTLAVDVSSDGVIIETSRSPIAINSSVLTEVVNTALDSEQDYGRLNDLHIAWKRQDKYTSYTEETLLSSETTTEATTRIAIVDTTALDSAFAEQVNNDLVIVAVALAALFAISWGLASWALGPVEAAWEGQKRFIADASHELKTPLAVIVANTDILLADEGLGEESRRWVKSTADEAANMRTLVNDLLELARTDEGAGSKTMQHVDVDLSDLVDSAVLEFDAVAFENGCQIEASIDENVHVEGDPEWLARLSKILMDNACKYAAVGTTIEVSLTRPLGHPTLSVTNQGKPIDEEDLPHLFDRFYRSDKARDRETGGFGLGLAIAKGIAESHGGTIAATSSAEEGTRFTVTL